jgi:hypothetical protein
MNISKIKNMFEKTFIKNGYYKVYMCVTRERDLNIWFKMIMPSLPALFPNLAFYEHGNIIPIFRPHQIHK